MQFSSHFSSFPHTLALGMPMGPEWIVIGLIALLIFGKRLPSVAKSLGEGVKQFKTGLSSVTDDVNLASEEAQPQKLIAVPVTTALAAQPRFDPYTGQPIAAETVSSAAS